MVEAADQVKQAEAATIGRLIVHEVHRPAVIDRLRYCQWLGLFPRDAFARLDLQVQLQFPIDPVHRLVISAVAFYVAQVQHARDETPVALIVRNPDQVVSDFGIFRGQPRLLAIAGDSNPEGLCWLALANYTLSHLSPRLALANLIRYTDAAITISVLNRNFPVHNAVPHLP